MGLYRGPVRIMSRFFADKKNIFEDHIVLTDKEDVKHLSKVLRHRIGDVIEISDNDSMEYEIELTAITPEKVIGHILDAHPFEREPKTRVTLYQGIPKQSKMELIIQKTVEQERELIESLVDSSSSIFLVAVMEGQIVGTCNFNAFVRHKRISHRGEFGIAVQKRAWGKGVGTMLMARMLDFAKRTAHVEVVSCEVRSDNLRAIALYRKFGFGKVGTFHKFFKIGDTYADCDLMNLYV